MWDFQIKSAETARAEKAARNDNDIMSAITGKADSKEISEGKGQTNKGSMELEFSENTRICDFEKEALKSCIINKKLD